MPQSVIDFFTNITFADCIATILSIVALVAPIISSRKRLDIEFVETECLYFPKAKEYETTITKFQAFARIMICNRSSVPITITSMDFGPEAVVSTYPLQSIHFFGHTKGIPCVTSYDIGEHQLKFPITLDPYQACDGYIFFRFFPDVPPKTHEISLKIKTSRHRKAIKKICKFTYYALNPAFELSV